jgi:hypothetical protein
MPTEAYLDWNATAKLRPEAQAAVIAALDVTGNPSSVHAAGRAARRLIEAARDKVAALVGVTSRDVVFTSGGTEANMLALAPALGEVLLISAIEHPSVRSGGRFAAAEDIAVTAAGVVDLVGVDGVERTVGQRRFEVDDGVAGKGALLGDVAHALLDAGPEVAWHGAADDARGELDAGARVGLDIEEDLAELAATAGLLLVPALDGRLAADGFSIRDAGRPGNHGRAELALELLDGDGDLVLALRPEQLFAGLLLDAARNYFI